MTRVSLLCRVLFPPLQAAIKHIDLIHLSHADLGSADHPAVCREMQIRYLDIALDAGVLADSLTIQPVVTAHAALREDPRILRNLFRP